MAKFHLTHTELTVLLRPGEKLAAIHGNLTVPRSQVVSVQIVSLRFWRRLGWRVPGTSLPPLIVSGTYLKKGDKAFVSYFKGQTPVEIVLTGNSFNRLIIGADSLPEAEAAVRELSPTPA